MLVQPSVCNKDPFLGDALIADRLRQLGKSMSNLLSVSDQKKLQRKIENDKNYKQYLPKSTVLLDLSTEKHWKENDPKRCQMFRVRSIDYRQYPVLFRVENMSGKKVKGMYIQNCYMYCTFTPYIQHAKKPLPFLQCKITGSSHVHLTVLFTIK